MESKKYLSLRNMTMREKFPKDFKTFLRNFVVNYIIADPSNVIDFGLQYFGKDVELRKLTPGREEENLYKADMQRKLSEASIKSVKSIASKGHREGVVTEIYDPEEDEFEEDGLSVKGHKRTEAQTNHLISTVKNVFAFRILDHQILQTIVDHMHYHRVKKGEYLMREGFNAERFFVIERGTFKEQHHTSTKAPKGKAVKDAKTSFKLMIDNGHFGQLALHYHHIIPNTVMADTDGEVWYIERQVFRRLVLKHAYAKMKQFSEICNEVVLLDELSEDAKMDLYDAFEQKEFSTQAAIYNEGEEPKGMYFIQFGNVKTYHLDKKEQEVDVRYFVKGDYFGEIEILGNKTRTCIAVSVGPVKAAFLPVECFERVLGSSRYQMEEKLAEYEEKVEYLHGVPELVKESGQLGGGNKHFYV